MKSKTREEGAALIVVVLLAVLMLAALLVVSANLSLSARRTTGEQKAILPAQYSAESGIAYAKSLLDASQRIMITSTLPVGTTYGTLKSWIASLCQNGASVPVTGFVKANASDTIIPGTSVSVPQSAKVCDVPQFSISQANFFAQLISNTGAAALAYTQAGIPAASTADRQAFFDKVFSANRATLVNGAQVQAGLRPVTLLQTDEYAYALYFRVAGVDSLGKSSDSNRRITVRGNETVHAFTFKFVVPGVPPTNPNFTSFGQFVNQWGSHDGYYGYGNDFSGPFHTNSIPSFRGVYGTAGVKNGSSISIDGALTSSGYSTITTNIDAQGNRIDTPSGNRVNGLVNDVINGNDSYIMANEMGSGGSQGAYNLFGATKISNKVDKSIYIQIASGNGNPNPKFDADFINMPINSRNQRDLASTAGVLVSDPQKITLSASGGVPASYQSIEIVPTVGSLTSPIRLRYGQDKKMFIETYPNSNVFVNAIKSSATSTGWIAAGTGVQPDVFNGMIYADGDIGSLSGPTRLSAAATTANGGAAIAKFAGITVVSQGSTTLTGDVKYETRCPSIRACTSKTNGQYDIKNIFGLYSSTGDVRLAYNPTTLNQNTAPGASANAPKNLEIDGFVMAGRGHIIPYNASASNPYDFGSSGNGRDKGTLTVRGGAIKDEDAIVKSGSRGWSENYYFDARGTDYSPPGFPTTSVGVPGVDPTNSTLVADWQPALGKTNPDGTQSTDVDFTLMNEFRQEKAQ
ncbi:hypothetical protein FNU79_08955 [Deinococcus detaillensis]|uniref:DUF4900 domain-containing protein n=1 Tax=Deinococcus detaillensis TaxID=2592048 RepID=A0A553V099_9DEIO|nr:hypothetical protein [Deinococcus detaillensis]TSA85896.1 hypothetical protein FNU79_08955 [Deinococcus detaillensis]